MVKIEINNKIAEIVLDDGKVNALDVNLMEKVMDGLDRIESSEANSLIITGEGNCFSAGIDLVKMLKDCFLEKRI